MTSQNTRITSRQPESANASSWTSGRIRALGSTTDLPTLASILQISRWKAYEMARTGQWASSGIRIIRVGACYKVSVTSILAALGEDQAS